ncbi:MAG: hypothetical protein R3C61_27670 [Bacteroidia bacterium]
MYPIFSSIEVYRKNHLALQKLNTEEDPDWVTKLGIAHLLFPNPGWNFSLQRLIPYSLSGRMLDSIWFFKRFGGMGKKQNSQSKRNMMKLIFTLYYLSAHHVAGNLKSTCSFGFNALPLMFQYTERG